MQVCGAARKLPVLCGSSKEVCEKASEESYAPSNYAAMPSISCSHDGPLTTWHAAVDNRHDTHTHTRTHTSQRKSASLQPDGVLVACFVGWLPPAVLESWRQVRRREHEHERLLRAAKRPTTYFGMGTLAVLAEGICTAVRIAACTIRPSDGLDRRGRRSNTDKEGLDSSRKGGRGFTPGLPAEK